MHCGFKIDQFFVDYAQFVIKIVQSGKITVFLVSLKPMHEILLKPQYLTNLI